MKDDPLDRLISMSRQTPPPEPGEPPPFLHARVMAALLPSRGASLRRQWALYSFGSLPVAAAIAIVCAWQRPLSPASETKVSPEEDAAGLIASALVESTIPQP